eukprot:Gb_31368 [translate_table: standard]
MRSQELVEDNPTWQGGHILEYHYLVTSLGVHVSWKGRTVIYLNALGINTLSFLSFLNQWGIGRASLSFLDPSESRSLNSSSKEPPVPRTCSSTGSSNSENYPSTPKEGEELKLPSQLLKFTFNELKSATRNFRPESILGEGGFGCVFKGWIEENGTAPVKPGTGLTVAVKTLNHDGLQGHKEWVAEVNFLGQLHHPNLVKLIGYCIEDDQRLLVYEFMPRGSLENHLFRRVQLLLRNNVLSNMVRNTIGGTLAIRQLSRNIEHSYLVTTLYIRSTLLWALEKFVGKSDGLLDFPRCIALQLWEYPASPFCYNRNFNMESASKEIGIGLLLIPHGLWKYFAQKKSGFHVNNLLSGPKDTYKSESRVGFYQPVLNMYNRVVQSSLPAISFLHQHLQSPIRLKLIAWSIIQAEGSLPLPWSIRMKIALGAAKGLAFLHGGAERPVIYRDFKTSNILLDSDYNAKLSDFGLAKDGPEGDNTHVSTRVMGTYGYAAPEYVMTGERFDEFETSGNCVFVEIVHLISD